ncbi:hypothetical protein CBL_03356 [Carabus blaptoides fortunei]
MSAQLKQKTNEAKREPGDTHTPQSERERDRRNENLDSSGDRTNETETYVGVATDEVASIKGQENWRNQAAIDPRTEEIASEPVNSDRLNVIQISERGRFGFGHVTLPMA